MASAAVHDGTAAALTEQRTITLDAAFAAHPIRFKGLAPKPPALPAAAWINPPKKEATPVPGDNQKPTFSDNPPMHLMVNTLRSALRQSSPKPPEAGA